jgi:hypothetical protein
MNEDNFVLDETNKIIFWHARERDRHQWLVNILTRMRAKMLRGEPALAETHEYCRRLDELRATALNESEET